MCSWVYGQEKYRIMFTVSSNPEDYQNNKPMYESLRLTLIKDSKDITIKVKGKPCFGKLPNGVLTSKFKMLPGSTKDKIILAYKTPEIGIYPIVEPLELVYNLDLKYLINVPKNPIP